MDCPSTDLIMQFVSLKGIGDHLSKVVGEKLSMSMYYVGSNSEVVTVGLRGCSTPKNHRPEGAERTT